MKKLVSLLFILISLQSYSGTEPTIRIQRVDSLEANLLTTSDTEKLDVLLALCNELVEKNSEKCILYSKQALELARSLNQPQKEIKALIFLGRENSNFGNYFEALQSFKEAQKLAIEHALDRSLIDSWNEIGITYFNISNYDEAQKYYFKALKKAEEIKYKERIIGLQNNIAIIYSIYNNHEKALELLVNLLNIYKAENNTFQIALTSVNISNIYDELGDFEKGLEYINIAIPIFRESGNNLMLTSTLNNRGAIYSKQKRYDDALDDYHHALEIAEESNFENGITSSSLNLGRFYLDQKQYDKALNYFNKTVRIAIDNENKIRLMECYDGIATTYTYLGNYKQALDYTRLYQTCKDEIYNEQSQKQISELQIKYETEKKEGAIRNLQNRMKNQRRNLIILISGLLLISVLILRVLYLRQLNFKRKNLLLQQEKELDQLALEKSNAEKREKDLENLRLNEEMKAQEEINHLKQLKFRTELKHKERELAANALHIVSKNETLGNFRKLAEDAIGADKKEIQSILKRLIQEIDSNIHLDQDWDKFKMHFEEVHQGFFNNLLEHYTDLNTNELRFCAYLRLNLDTKEIARILNISVNAIEKRRYRLRKKLELGPSDSLFEFLSKF